MPAQGKTRILFGTTLLAFSAALCIFFASFDSKKMSQTLESGKPSSIHSLSYTSIDGEPISLSKYKGKKILIVNTAGECGYTPQYEGLQKLSEQYSGKLVVIGFPCNQFGGQEPGNEREIKQFCTKNYKVTFPMAAKVDVKGKNRHPVYAWLTEKSLNGIEDAEVKWNFNKFLIDENGHYLAHYESAVKPDAKELKAAIEKQ